MAVAAIIEIIERKGISIIHERQFTDTGVYGIPR